MRKHSVDIHAIASPEIENAVFFCDEDEIFKDGSIGEGAVGSLSYENHTTNRYLTLSTGAMMVLLRDPAIPPEMKLFKILCDSTFYELFYI